MIRDKKKMILCCGLIVLNVGFIWINSLLPREMSSALSRFVGSILSLFLPGDATAAEGEGHGILRKLAHFCEFCSLGALLSWLFWMVKDRALAAVPLAAATGVCIAAVDEIIQIFVPGRGPHIRDVGIDSLGVALGVATVWLLVVLRKRGGIQPPGGL